jgi:hypothetical protein
MKQSGSCAVTEESDKNNVDDKGNGEAENIDHILDNMFVQRPMTNVISLKDPPLASSSDDQKDDHQINESMNVSEKNIK